MNNRPSLSLKSNRPMRPSLKQVSHNDFAQNIQILGALAGKNITEDQWGDFLMHEKFIGNPEKIDQIHDYLMEHGTTINTIEELKTKVHDILEQ